MRALGYFRADPGVPEGHAASLTALRRAFQDYCDTKGHVGQGVFADGANTGEFTQFDSMLHHIRSGGLAYLVMVPSVVHLGASLEEQVRRLLELDMLNCQVVCNHPDMPDPLQGAVSAWRNQGAGVGRGNAIREGMKLRAAQGKGLGKPPYAYRIGQEGTLEPVAAEAEVVRSIFGMYLGQSIGVRTIARQLNESGIRTRRGQAWSMVTVRDILRNHAYIGTYHRFGLRIPGSYQAIVGAEEFKQVQDRMRSRSPGRRHPKAEPFLLAGILHCGYCGQRMMGVTRHQTWRRKNGERVRGEYRYYQCQSRINRSQCQYHTRRASELEAQVLELVKWPPSDAQVQWEPMEAVAAESRRAADAKLRGLDRRYMEWVERAAQGMITIRSLAVALQDVEAERQGLRQEAGFTDLDADGLQVRRAAQRRRLETEWPSLSIGEQQEVLRGLVARVNLSDRKMDLVFRG